jgi:hypothetical protein
MVLFYENTGGKDMTDERQIPEAPKKEDLGALEGVDFDIQAGISDDVRQKIVTELVNFMNDPRLSECSMKEIKLLTKIKVLGETFDDDIKRNIVEFYLTLKISKERKGRTALEDIARTPEYSMGMGLPGQQGVWSRFKSKLGGRR